MPRHSQEYLEEGKRRMRFRKDKRNNRYREVFIGEHTRADRMDLSISQYRQYKKYGHWVAEDGTLRQVCSYIGHCEFPCNGDC